MDGKAEAQIGLVICQRGQTCTERNQDLNKNGRDGNKPLYYDIPLSPAQ